MTKHSKTEGSILDGVQEILGQFGDVFREPQVPPSRRHDHAVTLKEGANIPNLQPYKYPQYQKAEIDILVKEMLMVGIIRPSISPHSSPIILVKKTMVVGCSVLTIGPLFRVLFQIIFQVRFKGWVPSKSE